MKVNVHVTQKDIDQGMPSSPFSCPVAKALRRQLDDRRAAGMIAANAVRLYYGASIREVLLPASAVEFIDHFDRGDAVKPFGFSIDIPSKYLKPAKHRGGKHVARDNPGGPG